MSVAANIDAADLLKSDLQAQSKKSGWSVINHTQSSPNKKNVPVHVNVSKNITVANSFYVLENEPVLVDTGMDEQQVDRDAPSNTRQPNTPGSVKMQQQPKYSGARSGNSKDLIHVDEQKAVAVHVAPIRANLVNTSNEVTIYNSFATLANEPAVDDVGKRLQ